MRIYWYIRVFYCNNFRIDKTVLKFFEKFGNNLNSKLSSNRMIYVNIYAPSNSLFHFYASPPTLYLTLLYPQLHHISYIRYFLYIVWTGNSTQLQVSYIQALMYIRPARTAKALYHWLSNSGITSLVISHNKLNSWIN